MFILKPLVIYGHIFIKVHLLFLFLLIFLLLICLNIESPTISLHIVDYINICSIDIFQCSLLRVESDSSGFIDTNNFNSVSWFHKINQFLISTQVNCLRGLTFWYTFRCFLNFHMLFVTKHTLVVNQLETLSCSA